MQEPEELEKKKYFAARYAFNQQRINDEKRARFGPDKKFPSSDPRSYDFDWPRWWSIKFGDNFHSYVKRMAEKKRAEGAKFCGVILEKLKR